MYREIMQECKSIVFKDASFVTGAFLLMLLKKPLPH